MIINTSDDERDTFPVPFSHIFLPFANASNPCVVKTRIFLFVYCFSLFLFFPNNVLD